jgi:YD repeat-containing protein
MEIAGSVAIESFLTINNPSVTVEYFNAWGEPTQIITIESENIAQVTETLHDHLGRRTITTKATRMTRNADEPLIAFYESFIVNDSYEDLKSVWFTHQLKGEANDLNPKCEGFPYKRTEFEKNPSRDKKAVGLPGKEFSIVGPYSKKIESKTDLPFLLNLFPVGEGFTMYTKINENGSKKVSVFNVNDKKVAVYVRVPGFDHILSINEYDSEGRIVKILPPTYHEKVGTFKREDSWTFGDEHLSDEEKELQMNFGSHFRYDEDGNLIWKSTPDGGTVEYVYDESANRRFMKLSDGKVVYFLYDDAEQLIETGHLKESADMETLKSLANAAQLPDNIQRIISQEFEHSNQADDPLDRKATKKFVTHNENEKVTDEITFDSNDHVTRRSTAAPSTPSMNVEKTFDAKKLSSLNYPKENANDPELNLIFKYDKKGLLTSIGTSDDPTHYAQFTYTADGQLASEKIQPKSNHEYTRNYEYQTAGFLEKITDPFLSENIYYTSKGYGQKGFGDGIISSTAFKATWSKSADAKNFKVGLNELSGDKKLFARCFKILQKVGYLSATGVVEKMLMFKSESELPMECKGKVGYEIAKLIARKQTPKVYGHRYAYGNHQELTRAKYFTDVESMKAEPLQADSFAKELKNFKIEDSKELWKILTKGEFIVTDQRSADVESAIGKQGKKSIVRAREVEAELKVLASPTFDAMKALPEIINLIIK